MCGITGIIGSSETQRKNIKNLCQAISHRGPDADDIYIDENISLGHRRLSIIDLSPLGNQPMVSTDGNFVLVFNGEIYNFKEIKTELQAIGYTFRSTSDTEVVLYAYQAWGQESFNRFNGMFALAIYDKVNNTIILARDHAGIKPLYYYISEDKFIFSSEIRGFKAYDPNWPANEDWPVYFLSFGFIPFPYTTLKNVLSLPKGSYLKYKISASSEKRWTIHPIHSFSFTSNITSETEAIGKVREITFAALNRHMIADAPLGIFLSGGIDSSLCALIADYLGHKDLNTLSITFSEATFNEEPYQHIVLNRMRAHNHSNSKVDEKMFMEHLDDIFNAMDQPSWDGVNSYFISKCAHEAGLKAVLSGLGGDELFGGYPSFQRINLLKSFSLIPGFIKSFAKYAPNDAMVRLAFLNANTLYKEYLFLRGAFTPDIAATLTGMPEKKIIDTLSNLIIPNYPLKHDGNLAAYLETNIYMENQLLKDTDYMSMWHSLEVRVPFLDKKLMELMYMIHPSVKFNFSQPKYLLTKAFKDLLPNEIVFRKKQGFTFPFSIWLKKNINHFKPLLPDTPITDTLVNKFLNGKQHWSRVWALIVWKKFMK
jgi:asparagine synthase (glutamine-hydrolysing)